LGSVDENDESSEITGEHTQRGDNVLGIGSLIVGVLAALAATVLLVEGCRLMGWIPSTPPYHELLAGMVVLGLSAFCFFEAYRFYRFFDRPEIRDRYYARHQSRRDSKD